MDLEAKEKGLFPGQQKRPKNGHRENKDLGGSKFHFDLQFPLLGQRIIRMEKIEVFPLRKLGGRVELGTFSFLARFGGVLEAVQ